MPATTTCATLPYPLDADPIDVANDMRLLAQAVDAQFCLIAKLPLGAIIPYLDTGAVLPAEFLRLDGSPFSPVTYPALSAYLGGSSVVPDLRDRFLRGTSAPGGAFDTPGGFGGWADATLVQHEHGMNHTHAPFNTPAGGSHKHRIRGNNTTSNSGGFGEGNTASWGLTAFTVLRDTETTTHVHTIAVPNFTGVTTQVGAAGTNRNLPPFFNVTFIIKARP